ncbi:MAG: Uma2 family endonuclease [Saprospiraceae bacterium]|nr:Uma2 family endonuclease [Saprospiraceae bacterium]
MTSATGTTEQFYSVKEWLEFEKTAEVRHEYYHGKLIPMAGEAKRANRIAGNLKKLLDDPLYQKGFDLFDHDVKVEVVPSQIYRYPDLVAAPTVDDEHDFIVKKPVFMAEIASDKSGHRDRIKKRMEYLAIPSLWYYLIADQDEMLLELHIRNTDDRGWTTQYFTEPNDVVRLDRFGMEFTLGQVYERLTTPKV